ncbi:ABC transporter ATP-binding protein [Telmatocola sphagniphila]|jgi:ABC-type polysaccharide/polyol phosphate transport system ATPase subunit|uniref:ABC transporter ATP-binding protein n=1 Tax=Telmatocola sphagniphila TaxID=1123043 RepID=A0A8E6B740_9BACT|nr:ABC transporter ATP-binding protein [Telmatocola sphagniphila]QVL32956.1 ABC transporter ATP-binding protein [Telmatocola sphagniphila]
MAEILLEDVNLKFRVRQSRRTTLKEYLVRGLFRKSVNPFTEVHSLKDVNLRLVDGDRLGVIGHNGAGKSTLMKLVAGIYPPTSGYRTVHGNICSLFDIALGFESESNGWDNIYYRGYLQGENPKTIREKIDQIAEFSELGSFLDMPVRYYSAGMLVRLAFSIASAIQPEILLVDEVLAVGDLSFQMKARKRMTEMMKTARLMMLISHDLETLPGLCTKVAWMDHGVVRMVGPTEEVIQNYRASVHPVKKVA